MQPKIMTSLRNKEATKLQRLNTTSERLRRKLVLVINGGAATAVIALVAKSDSNLAWVVPACLAVYSPGSRCRSVDDVWLNANC